MSEHAIMTKEDSAGENEQIRKIIQLSFFSEITDEDIRKTKWLLQGEGRYFKGYVTMLDTVQNYEVAMNQIQNGLNAYELLAAEGTVARRESSHDLIANIPESAAILKERRQVIYKMYVAMTTIIRCALQNIRDPHEALIAKLLFLDRMKYLKALAYLEAGYRKDTPSISPTTFADKRRRVIASCTNSFKLNGALDFVLIDYGRGRNKNGEVGLRLPNAEG